MNFVTLESEHSRKFLRGLLDGVKSRAIRIIAPKLSNREHVNRVKTFFEENRQNPAAVDLADVGSGPFAAAVEAEVGRNAPGFARLVDVGCGDASLQTIASELNLSYVGVDLSTCGKSAGAAITFIEANADSKLLLPPSLGSSVFVAANVLCYYQDMAEFWHFLKNNSQCGDRLILLEPRPSLLWESYFSGVRVQLRNNLKILTYAESFDWTPMHQTEISLFAPLSIPLFLVSSLTVLNRRQAS